MKKITFLAMLLLGYMGVAQTCQDATVTLDGSGMASITLDDVYVDGSGPNYVIDQTGTFAPIDISGTGTEVLGLGDDDMSDPIPIGFTFDFFGDGKTEFLISSNGFITFDLTNTDNGCCSGDVLPDTGEAEDLIAFAWEDLDPGNGPGGGGINTVRFETVGTAPNRVLVMEFFQVDHWSSGDNVTAQVHLIEGSNVIEIHTTTQPAPGNHTMGIENAAGDEAYTVPGRNGQAWTATNDFASFTPVTYVADITTFTCDDVGANTVTVEGQDADGNVLNSCTSTVTVMEAAGPILECQDITVTLDDMGMATITAGDLITNAIPVETDIAGTGLPAPITGATDGVSPATVDLPGVIGTDFSIDNVNIDVNHTFDGDLVITLESPDGTSLLLADFNGGSSSGAYVDTTFQDGGDNIDADTAPFNGTYEPEGGTFAAAFAGETVAGDWILRVDDTFGDGGTFNAFNIEFAPIGALPVSVPTSCGTTSDIVLDISSFDCMSVGDNTVTITATSSGGVTTCTPTVTVVPSVDIDGPVDIFTGTGAGDENCETNVSYSEPIPTAVGCADGLTATLVSGLASGEAFPVGTTTVEYSITNSADFEVNVFSFDVTVSDTTDPSFDCPDEAVVVGADDAGNYTIEDYTAGITDNCTAAADLISTQDPVAGTVVTEGSTTTITVTSTDEAGNVTECSFDLTVDSTLGTNDIALDASLSVFPNPTNGIITVRNGGNQVLTEVSIIDANGRIVMTKDLSTSGVDTQLDLNKLASGIYFARINSETATTVKRIVKK